MAQWVHKSESSPMRPLVNSVTMSSSDSKHGVGDDEAEWVGPLLIGVGGVVGSGCDHVAVWPIGGGVNREPPEWVAR